MSKTNKSSRNKRSTMVINLIQTPAGYSVIQGTDLLNKPSVPPQQTSVPAQNVSSTSGVIVQPIVKQQKMVTKQKNLIFLKGPTDYSASKIETKTHIKTPNQAKFLAEWLDLNSLHPIQNNQIKTWLFQNSDTYSKISDISEDDDLFNETVEKYIKHRNIIVTSYYQKYWPNRLYMGANRVRKIISDDAYWIMKIHMFLTNWGIINRNHINLKNQTFNPLQILHCFQSQKIDIKQQSKKSQKQINENKILQFFEDEQRALNSVTQNIRPYCDFCGLKCSITWFQHIRTVDSKQIQTIMKNVNSKNPPLSQKAYEIILCISCFCNGSFPLLLTHQDFKKITVNDRLQPNRKKKKQKKHKKKQKKRRDKQKQRVAAEQDEIEIEYNNQQAEEQLEGSVKQKYDRQREQSNNFEDRQSMIKKQKKQGDKVDNTNNNNVNNQEGQKNDEIQQQNNQTLTTQDMINEIINNIKKQEQLSLQATQYLLQLVQEHNQQNWSQIYKQMQKKGYCQQMEISDLIKSFILIPKTFGQFKLKQQYDDQGYIQANTDIMHKTNVLQKITAKNYSLILQQQKRYQKVINQYKASQAYKMIRCKIQEEKQLYNRLMILTAKRISQKSDMLEKIWKKSKQCALEADKKIKGIYG